MRIKLFTSILSLFAICVCSSAFARETPVFAPNPQDWQDVKGTHVSWGTTDFSFNCHQVPLLDENKNLKLIGWRGEKLFAKAVIWTAVQLDSVNFVLSDMVGKDGSSLKAADCEAGFMMNVISDYDEVIRNGCKKGKKDVGFESGAILVPDMIDTKKKSLDLPAMYTQSIWMTFPIPANDYVGEYKGTLTIKSKGAVIETLPISITSTSRVLPEPKDWKHETDFWVHYYPLADYYKVPYWSKAHFKWLKLVYKRLLAAGQKSVRVSVGGPNEKKMVQWTLEKDGTWSFDYTVLDKVVEFAGECGMNGMIDCHGLSHRKGNHFQYIDASDGQSKTVSPGFDDGEYAAILHAAVTSLSKHLKEKGWFERAYVSTDELKHNQNEFFINAIRKADPQFKIKTASNKTDTDLEAVFDHLSYASHCQADMEILKERKAEGKTTTQYICCSETHPNRYVFSDPYECTYISYNTFLKGLDGFLCWAFCYWGPNELKDTRRSLFYSGEYQMIYPYDKTSQRWEKYIEGVQDYEKLRILTEEYTKTKNKAALKALDKALAPLKAMAWNNTREDVFDTQAVPQAIADVKALLVK